MEREQVVRNRCGGQEVEREIKEKEERRGRVMKETKKGGERGVGSRRDRQEKHQGKSTMAADLFPAGG